MEGKTFRVRKGGVRLIPERYTNRGWEMQVSSIQTKRTDVINNTNISEEQT